MSFNPKWSQQNTPRRDPSPPPGRGRTHAQIMASRGYYRESIGPRTNTKTGFFELAMESKDFVVRRETLLPNTSIGYGVAEKGDRFVIVERGLLYALIEDEAGNVVTERLPQGAVFSAPRGKKHGYATSLERAEVFVVESAHFQKSWKQLQEGVETTAAIPVDRGPSAIPERDRALDAVTRQQMQQEAARRGIRAAEGQAVAGGQAQGAATNAIGVNLRPSGPPVE